MSTRRDFLKIGGSAAAAMLMAGSVHAARREVCVGGKRVKVVDLHAHCFIPEAAQMTAQGAELMRHAPRSLIRSLTLRPQRLESMDARGIDIQALSVNQYWWYAADRDLAVRAQDEGLAAWCSAHPDRFVALTSVALQYPDLAAQQLQYAVEKLAAPSREQPCLAEESKSCRNVRKVPVERLLSARADVSDGSTAVARCDCSVAWSEQTSEHSAAWWMHEISKRRFEPAGPMWLPGCRRLQQAHEFRPEKRRNSPSPNTNATLCRA